MRARRSTRCRSATTRVRDLRADFEQTSLSVALGTETISNGAVIVERPGKMRWEYAAPDGRVIVLDKDSIRIWNPEEKQLQIARALGGKRVAHGARLPARPGGAARHVQRRADRRPARAERGLRLRPKSDGGFELLELWVDPKTYELRESVVLDLFGNRTRLRLDDLRENSGVAEHRVRVRGARRRGGRRPAMSAPRPPRICNRAARHRMRVYTAKRSEVAESRHWSRRRSVARRSARSARGSGA